MFTPEQRSHKIEKIRQLPAQLAAVVLPLSAEQLTTHYLANEWSVAQNVHHLADSHLNSFSRLKLILTEDNPPLKPYKQDDWAVLADATQADISDSLFLLTGLHRRWVRLFESLTEEQWQRRGLHGDVGPVTVEDLLRIYAAHGEGHIGQIERTLAAGG